jgi:hypothetical protein
MPTPANLTGGGAQLGTVFVRSILVRAFASAADQSVEVPAASARYFSVDQFSGTNQGGTFLGTCTIDTSDVVFAHYGRANIQDTLTALFPPPAPGG